MIAEKAPVDSLSRPRNGETADEQVGAVLQAAGEGHDLQDGLDGGALQGQEGIRNGGFNRDRGDGPLGFRAVTVDARGGAACRGGQMQDLAQSFCFRRHRGDNGYSKQRSQMRGIDAQPLTLELVGHVG